MISDIRYVICDMVWWYVKIYDIWYTIRDISYMTYEIWYRISDIWVYIYIIWNIHLEYTYTARYLCMCIYIYMINTPTLCLYTDERWKVHHFPSTSLVQTNPSTEWRRRAAHGGIAHWSLELNAIPAGFDGRLMAMNLRMFLFEIVTSMMMTIIISLFFRVETMTFWSIVKQW